MTSHVANINMKRPIVVAASALVALVLQPEAAGGSAPAPSPGETVFRESGCGSCHGKGRIALPDVSGYSPEDLREVLERPPSGMPRFLLSAPEREALLAYLLTKPPSADVR